jgi:hypothetical protein
MKRWAAFIGVSVLILGLSVLAADQPVSLSGTWILDSKKSDPAPRPIMNLGAPGFNTGGMGGGMGGAMPGGGMDGGMPDGGMGGGMPGGGMGGGMPGGGMGGGMPGGGMGGGMPGGGRGPGAAQSPEGNAPLVIDQTANEIKISRSVIMNGKEAPIVESYALDGKEIVETLPVPNTQESVKRTTKAILKKNKFEVHTVIPNPQGKYETKKEYSLSKDGKVLTVKTSTRRQMGMNVFDTVQRQIYDKQ